MEKGLRQRGKAESREDGHLGQGCLPGAAGGGGEGGGMSGKWPKKINFEL